VTFPPAERIPLRVRWPWFALWVPLVLLLYVLINGGGYILEIDPGLPIVRRALQMVHGGYGLLFWPILTAFAYASWRLVPRWKPSWLTAQVVILQILLILFAMLYPSALRFSGSTLLRFYYRPEQTLVVLQAPNNWDEVRCQMIRLWKPHLPGLDRQNLLMKDPDPRIRRQGIVPALWQLGDGGDPLQASKVAPFLEDPDPEVRSTAAAMLIKLGAQASYVPELTRLLHDPDMNTRYDVAMCLGKIGDSPFVPAITGLLKDPNVQVRLFAVSALGKSGSHSCVPAIARLLEDLDPQVQATSALALGKLGARSCVPAIEKLFMDASAMNAETRGILAVALGYLGDRSFAGEIAKLLETSDDYYAASALESLSGESWPKVFPDRIKIARAWWAAHKNDPEFSPRH